jgi:hypothetical protein
MPSQGPLYVANGADDAGVGTVAWSNPSNAAGNPDDGYATAALGSGAVSHYLKCTSFGFSVPAGATIDGIVVEWEKQATGAGGVTDARVRLVKADAVGATDRSSGAAWPGTDGFVSHGGAADLWGDTWAPADVNAGNFGAAIAAQAGPGGATARVDSVRCTVYYTAPGKPPEVQVFRADLRAHLTHR